MGCLDVRAVQTHVLLTASYVAHVAAAVFWVGGTFHVAYSVVFARTAAALGPEAVVVQMDRLLGVTRWTGLVLPLTGGYQLWHLYSLETLAGTPRGWLVIGMLALWGGMNTAVELGVFAMRRTDETVGYGAFLREGFPVESLGADVSVEELLAAGRGWILVAVALGAALVVDAALLAMPVVPGV